MDTIEERIIAVISKVSEIAVPRISCSSTFEELSLTSLDTVMIAFDLEEEFGVELPDSEVYTISTVQELIDEIRPLLETNGIDG